MFLKIHQKFIDFFFKEWLLIILGFSLLLTSMYTCRLPNFSTNELEVLFILFTLFISIQGLNNSRFLVNFAYKIEKGNFIPFKLTVTTFFLSMLLTNDVALLTIVPLTLMLNVNRKGILVIFEALAANAGSALTPFGNPQNLFIYWFYHISIFDFIKTIAPFSLIFLVILAFTSLFIKISSKIKNPIKIKVSRKSYIYIILTFVFLLAILRVLPIKIGFIILIFALIFDRKALKVDYVLLLSILFFFGITDNIKIILTHKIGAKHIFLTSFFASQIMSNVPATLLFSKFTTNWQALLWGVNSGGFGSLFGSLANLIAYRIYTKNKYTTDKKQFTLYFLLFGYVAFFISLGLYFVLH